MRRIILFGIICAMLFSQAVSYAAGNSADAELEVLSQSEDRRYDEALSMLCNLNLTVKTDCKVILQSVFAIFFVKKLTKLM